MILRVKGLFIDLYYSRETVRRTGQKSNISLFLFTLQNSKLHAPSILRLI